MSFFQLIKTDDNSNARLGRLKTAHGTIDTPVFMPVGTQGTVKAVQQRELVQFDAKVILGNTYHLYLRPGNDVLHRAGGLHKFMNWDRALLTDSGGYQVFSLKEIRKISQDGVDFKSHIDGSNHFFSPENVVDTQRIIGSDIMMVLDECVSYPSDYEYTRKSCDLSLSWAFRALNHLRSQDPLYGFDQHIFAIGQGGTYPDLRKYYIDQMTQGDFDGFSIGGLSVGEPDDLLYEMTDLSCQNLPKEKPRYLMGVGTPENLLNCIELGVDMFDCVMPTRNARNGQLFTTNGKVNIRNAKYKFSTEPIDLGTGDYPGNTFTLGYLRHLIVADEILGLQIASLQNISFYLWLMKNARINISNGNFVNWKKEFLNKYKNSEKENG